VLTRQEHAKLNRLIAIERKAARAKRAYWVKVTQRRPRRRK